MIFVREELCYKLVLEGINQARGASAGMAKDGKGWQRMAKNHREPMFSRQLAKLAVLRQVC